MFEKRLIELSRMLKNTGSQEYYILTHKKHKREIYFQNSERAISFILPKFNSQMKKIIYFFIKIGFLQFFLKKRKLSNEFGDAVYVANQIKGFDLRRKTVISFPNNKKIKKNFLKSKEIQEKIAKKGFAPIIYRINKKIPFSKEILAEEYSFNYSSIFKKLNEFYNSKGIEKIPIGRYVSKLKKKTKDKKILEKLNAFSNKKFNVFITTLHGDVAKENVMKKNRQMVFIDWNSYRGPITDDLISLLKKPELNDKFFMSMLKFYPRNIRQHFKDYFLLSKISLKINKN